MTVILDLKEKMLGLPSAVILAEDAVPILVQMLGARPPGMLAT